MTTCNITIPARKVQVEYGADRQMVEVELEGVDVQLVIDEIGVNEVLSHISNSELAQYVFDNNIDVNDI